MSLFPKIEINKLRSICTVIGDTQYGLTGSQIAKHLKDCGINDPFPGYTKKDRLFEALKQKQEHDKCSNNVWAFIKSVMDPVNYTTAIDKHTYLIQNLNIPLAFLGWKVTEKGDLEAVTIVRTITEAKERTTNLKRKLSDRKIHPEVLRFCNEELLKENYFHAILEATKSIADRIRILSSMTDDGAELINKTMGLGSANQPKLAINRLSDATEISEHKGFSNFLIGLFGMFRNTTAHVPKIKWAISEDDAAEALTIISYAHKRLDECYKTPW